MEPKQKLEERILETIEILDPSIEDKTEFAKDLANEIYQLLDKVVKKNQLNWSEVINNLVQIVGDKELLETYKNHGKKGVADIWYYAVIREKKKYKPRVIGRVEECTIIPYGISTVRRMKDTPTCILYALRQQEDSFTPISIFMRGPLRNLAKDIELINRYTVKLENRGFFFEAVDETKFEGGEMLDVTPEDFYTKILPKFNVTVKQVEKIIDFTNPSNLSQLDQSGFPIETDLRIVSGVVDRKTCKDDTEKCVYVIYDGSVDEPVPTEDYVVPIDFVVLSNLVFSEFEVDDWITVVGYVFPVGELKELMFSAINILPRW